MKKILLVEDNATIREELSMLLQFEGYQVLDTNKAANAIKLVEQYKPDLIISDILLQDFDGFELIQNLKANETTKNIPFIFVTTSASKNNEALAYSLGAINYLVKPFKAEVLLEIIKSQINSCSNVYKIKSLPTAC